MNIWLNVGIAFVVSLIVSITVQRLMFAAFLRRERKLRNGKKPVWFVPPHSDRDDD